jgi:hypothetical protein
MDQIPTTDPDLRGVLQVPSPFRYKAKHGVTSAGENTDNDDPSNPSSAQRLTLCL